MKRGVLYSPAEAEGRRKRNPFDTVTEGVGLNRLTNNFALAHVDDAVQCSDQVLLIPSCVAVCEHVRPLLHIFQEFSRCSVHFSSFHSIVPER